MKQDDGGPAFPTDSERQIADDAWHFEGMTLLDYFAGQYCMVLRTMALMPTTEAFACSAYDYATAMVAEKRRRENAS